MPKRKKLSSKHRNNVQYSAWIRAFALCQNISHQWPRPMMHSRPWILLFDGDYITAPPWVVSFLRCSQWYRTLPHSIRCDLAICFDTIRVSLSVDLIRNKNAVPRCPEHLRLLTMWGSTKLCVSSRSTWDAWKAAKCKGNQHAMTGVRDLQRRSL